MKVKTVPLELTGLTATPVYSTLLDFSVTIAVKRELSFAEPETSWKSELLKLTVNCNPAKPELAERLTDTVIVSPATAFGALTETLGFAEKQGTVSVQRIAIINRKLKTLFIFTPL